MLPPTTGNSTWVTRSGDSAVSPTVILQSGASGYNPGSQFLLVDKHVFEGREFLAFQHRALRSLNQALRVLCACDLDPTRDGLNCRVLLEENYFRQAKSTDQSEVEKRLSFSWKPFRSSTSRLMTAAGISPAAIFSSLRQAIRPMSRNSSSVQPMQCGARMTLSSFVRG